VIRYTLPVTCYADISVYNILGQKLATLVSQKQSAGDYNVEWDAADYASGIYLYKLSTDQGFAQTKKLIVLK
jgi:flagellar hook assembly protein FlgD